MRTDAARVLAANVATLMAASVDLHSQAALGRRARIDQRTVGRILHCEHSPTLKQLDAIAHAFGLLPWQLLVPQLQPESPPTISPSPAERELFDRLRTAARQIAGGTT